MNEPSRGPWYLITGLILGLVAGLVYAYRVQPLQYFDTSPAALQQQDKDQYRAMIALAYAANHDLVRARARLELLDDEDIFRTLTGQAQRALAEGSQTDTALALGQLALDLGQTQNPSGSPTSIPATPIPGDPSSTSAPGAP